MPCHSYIFFDSLPSLALLTKDIRDAYVKEFCDALLKLDGVTVASYATRGFKQNSYFMLHFNGEDADDIQRSIQLLMRTQLGAHLTINYTLLGLIRPSQYHSHGPQEEKTFIDGAMKYLIVYPFTKTIEWHLLPFEERKEIMKEHVMTARTFSQSISQLLLYSYGIDDHEFIVSYQTDSLLDFQTLVMELRAIKGRAYTKNDLPIFLCTYAASLADIL